MAQIREIAEKKMKDLNANDLEAACQMIDRLGPLDGPRGGGVGAMASRASVCKKAYEGIDRDAVLRRSTRR